MAYWQIAAGSDQRTYADRFTRHGMAFVGGDAQVKTMAGVQPGDVVVLKQGMTSILAVGRVVERDGRHSGLNDKHWLMDFDGWELRAWCFVDWHEPDKPVPVNGLTRATIQRVNQGHIVAEADRILADVPAKASYDPEPADTARLTDDQMTRDLIDHGLRPGAAEELTVALRRIRLLAGFYLGRKWDLTKEHEARTFLVIPLLQALGWAEQRIQIEWTIPDVGRADIACFRKPVRKGDEDCSILIETKNLSQGLFYATDQVNRYASKIPACEVVIVTNGYCYKAYRRDPATGTFPKLPTAYLNIRDPRTRYPLDPENTDGALAVLQMLIPN
ncbi:type I restriction enzyme HsdR N-terminal domain-containing protein [Aureimonas pseudogalii]|uniref:Type I restriction enzyme R protein N-terminal domain-containing protein n=1 Tax=Aureimonas pseudogalii TaxID=1744844 RepID=A0A7W6EBP6_9HYPH|nr:type I restriction enzyme HsdR N-terminal domain-containing protein [Aureimonas pseudogalii]MBB3998408.1 hypothetical protein [Aureimonas pseudogalii]